MVTFGELCELIRTQDPALEFVNILDMHDFIVEERVTAKGKYKVTLQFDAKEMLKNPRGIPHRGSDFIYRPHLMFLKWRPRSEDARSGAPSTARENSD